MRGYSRLLLLVSLAFSCGCFINPAEVVEELQFARQKPSESELTGRWVPTSETLKDMRINGGYAISIHELILNPDRTFLMKNMPDWWSTDFGNSNKGLQSASGRWALNWISGWQSWGIDLIVGTSVIGSLAVRNRRPPYLIHVGVGDPDNGHFMLFERSK